MKPASSHFVVYLPRMKKRKEPHFAIVRGCAICMLQGAKTSRPLSLARLPQPGRGKAELKGGTKFALTLNFCATPRRLLSRESRLFLKPTSRESLVHDHD